MKAKCLGCYAKLLIGQKLPCYSGNWIENGPQCPFDKDEAMKDAMPLNTPAGEMKWSPDDWNLILSPLGKWSIAAMFIGTACYLSIMNHDVPSYLVSIISAIMGYYFGSQGQNK